MKHIERMYDHQLQKPYDLYKVNARELRKRLYEGYGLDWVTLQSFNSESKLSEHLLDIEKMKARGYEFDESHRDIKKIEDIKRTIEQNEHVSDVTKLGVSFGYELMPLAVSVAGDFENADTQVELIDGFKRMFGIAPDQIPDVDILVKVYRSMNDAEWINSMLLYNSWKYSNGEGASRWMDRGFQLGLYYRYGIEFSKMSLPDWNMFHILNLYCTGTDLRSFWNHNGNTQGTYQTFWNNNMFSEDIKALHEIFSYAPVFRIKKRGKPEELYDMSEKKYYGKGIWRVQEVFGSILGQIRRSEFKNGITDRKPFDLSIYKNFLDDEANQKNLVKVATMTVDGFVCNFVRDHMKENIKKLMLEGMGYTYTAPPKRDARPFSERISVTEDML